MKGKFCSLFLYVLILMVCYLEFGHTNPLYISCDINYIKYCENNIEKYLRFETSKSENCSKICELKKKYKGRCDCDWYENGFCYNYMYCWKNEINGWCSGLFSKNGMGDLCLEPAFEPKYLKYEMKVTIGNSKYESSGFSALKKKGQTKICNC